MDATAKPLLHLCRMRAVLLRSALEALRCVSGHQGYCGMAEQRLDGVMQILGYIEAVLDREARDGRDSD